MSDLQIYEEGVGPFAGLVSSSFLTREMFPKF